jgi:beta-mannosidase
LHEIDLAALDWQWLGWRPWMWKLRASLETGRPLMNDIGPMPASVPGTVQKALLDAGLIEDWNVGMNSLACEWAEHRHWELLTRLPTKALAGARKIVLDAHGLDYSGWILVDNQQVATFKGVLKPHRIDLADHLADGEDHHLSIVFDIPPREQGQIGFTSQSRYFKPRYNYGWDWCPRLVPIGVWGPIAIRANLAAEFGIVRVSSDLAEDLRTGTLSVRTCYEPAGAPEDLSVRVSLADADGEIAFREAPLQAGQHDLRIEGLRVEPWWPNGMGPAKTYRLTVEVVAPDGSTLWQERRKVGFRRIRWLPCEGAPADALPWLCEVNGTSVFLQGCNWAPLRLAYADLTDGDYGRVVPLYRDMGCNLLRVWGGGYLETECFYDLCDDAGILVWQEFPLSSSGIDNWPPEDPEVIEELCEIARSYIRRRAHHPSLLMWCGGNELQGGADPSKVGGGRPTPPDHPCLAALAQVVREEDPGRRFVHTSSSGPRFTADASEFGQGLHHDVHGPWGFDGDFEGWREYWRGDDALFRSEVGVPGACDVELIKRYCPDGTWWPPNNATWAHSSLWWIMWDRYSRLDALDPEQALAAYVEQTQAEQAEALAFAAAMCKRRFPRCGGFMIWTGHDCFPCPINNSVIDFDGHCKPGYYALKKVFQSGPSDQSVP